jgi:hypothetical protein
MAKVVETPDGVKGVLLDPARDYAARVVLAQYARMAEATDPDAAREVTDLLAESAQNYSIHQSALLNRIIEGDPGERT